MEKINGSFADLLKPLEPMTGGQAVQTTAPVETAPPSGSNAATSSVASQNGAVTDQDALSGLKHTEIASTSLSGAHGQPATTPLTGAAPGASVNLGGIVAGEWAVNIIDAMFPAALVALMYSFGIKMRKTEMQLTAGEKNTLAPIMQKCLDSILVNFNNPWNALAITMGAIYGGKVMEKGLVGWIDKKQERQEQEALADRLKAADVSDNPAKYEPANQSANDLMTGKVVYLEGLPFTEADVDRQRKKGKVGREKAIEQLKRKHGLL